MKLIAGEYVKDFIVKLVFQTGNQEKTVYKDFLPLFQKYVKGENLIYFDPSRFKKFIVKNGNIHWGRNEDVIFTPDLLCGDNTANGTKEEILYII